jgi:hypothetical protein
LTIVDHPDVLQKGPPDQGLMDLAASDQVDAGE